MNIQRPGNHPRSTRSRSVTVTTITPSLAPGGIARSALDLARGLARSGHKQICLFENSGALETEWREFAEIRQFSPLYLTLGEPSRLIRTIHAIPRLPPDSIVWAHYLPNFEFGWVMSKISRVPFVAHLRTEPRSITARQSRAVRNADSRVAVSRSTRDHWKRLLGDVEIEVIPNGIDLEGLTPGAQLRSKSSDPLVVLFVGRLEPEKGLETAVKAFAEAYTSLPLGSKLRVVGSTSRQSYAAWASTLLRGTGPMVEMVGEVLDVATEMRRADLVVMPSTTEAFGRVAIEAMACGVPVFGAPVGGLREVLSNVDGNRLIQHDDVPSYGQALVEFSRARPFSVSASRSLRDRAENYSLEETIRRAETLLGRVLPG